MTSTIAAPKRYTNRLPTSKIDQHEPTLDQRKSTPSRSKPSAASGVVNLIRRATSRKPSIAVHESLAKDTVSSDKAVDDVPKFSTLVPRLLHRKLAELPPLITNTSRTPQSSRHASLSNTRAEKARPLPPLSPTGSARRMFPYSSPIREPVTTTTTPNIFDDDHLTSAKDIRAAITTSEYEVRKLVDAFNDLEASALRRFQRQHARRLPVTTPNVNDLLEGREWREHRLILSPSSPVFDFKERHTLITADSTGDGVSIHSGSSHQTNISQPKSISPQRKYQPGSPLSPHFRTPSLFPARKNSMSSISSQRTSFTSNRMLAVTPSSSLPRSTSHLVLPKLQENNASKESIGLEEGDDDSEISDIRRRREELVARYTARLEFLRAKLKGAELHEKLLRK